MVIVVALEQPENDQNTEEYAAIKLNSVNFYKIYQSKLDK